jgi:HAE1 family hydrophobic/amphiphilic exporter-1
MLGAVLRRPVGTAALYVAMLILAAVSITRIPIEGTPDMELPKLNVYTVWPGADPEAVCEQVTRPVEEAARQVEGVREISSSSENGTSAVTVSFESGTDMDVASMELAERVSLLRDGFPEGVMPSSITTALPRELESRGFLVYALAGSSPEALRTLAEDVIVPRLTRVDGVGSVLIEGSGEEEVVINLDPEALRSLDLTPGEVSMAIRTSVVDRSLGIVTGEGGSEFSLRLSTVPGDAEELGGIVIASRGGSPVLLRDVCSRIYTAPSENAWTIFRYDGLDQLSLQIDRIPGSSAVRVADRVKHEIEGLGAVLPEGVVLDLVEDGTEGVREDLAGLSWRSLLSIAAILACLMILNASLRSNLLILSSILFSTALSVTAVYLAGYSINVLTLSALAVAFGLIVDGAVVVMEAVAFRRREGIPPFESAEKGANEVALPILGGLLTTLVAFIPLLASEGVLRLYYRPFAYTITVTLLASYLVCLTLVPSLAAHWKSPGWFRERKWDIPLGRFFARLHHRPWIPFGLTLVLTGLAAWTFFAKVDKGRDWGFSFEMEAVTVWMEFPPGTPKEYVDEAARRFEAVLTGREEIESTRTYITGETAVINAAMTSEALESGTALVVEAEAMAVAAATGGVSTIYVGGISPEAYWRSSTSAGLMQTLDLRGYDYEGLRLITENLGGIIARHPRIGEVNTEFNRMAANRTQLAAVPDRQALADIGITPAAVLAALSLSLPGGYGGQIQIGDSRIGVSFRLSGRLDPALAEMLDTRIRGGGSSIRLGDLVRIDTLRVQGAITRENGEYVRTLGYSFMGPERMAARFKSTLLDNLELPPGYRVVRDSTWIPEWLREEERGTDLNLLVIGAIILVFAVTALLYESYTAPLYVLAVIPMAMIGVIAGFWAFGKLFTPQAYVGSVFLVGIAVNNSILLVDAFLRHLRSGETVKASLDAAVKERLRPVMQTSGTTIVGLLPLVLWPMGGSDDLWGTLSFTVICGMVTSTLLVLVALPSLIQLTWRRRR